ncbi:MAG TPA: hypothetical protein ENK43_09450 [Planctomycetes bacterium]|nr:hypothetical protein [Planctomycetota bacterium]
MTRIQFLIIGSIVGVLALSTVQASPKGFSVQDLEARVVLLEKKVKDMEASHQQLAAQVERHKTMLAKQAVFFERMVALTQSLENQIEEAKKKGFLAAGPNPAAKEALLTGLTTFSQGLRQASPIPPPAKKDVRTRNR